MKPYEKKNEKGFTLVELLVVMVIGSMALAGIYGMYRAQMKTHVTQKAIVDVQQNLRSALYFMQKSIRMAGYIDPMEDPIPSAGLLLDFSTYDAGKFDNPSNATTGPNSIAFTLDADASRTIGDNYFEIVAYRLNSDNEIQVWQLVDEYSTNAWEWVTIAENINNLEFTYYHENGDISDGTDLDAGTILTVRSIDIRIEAQVEQGNPMLDAEKTSRSISARVKCRNLGIERSI